jgi:polysaccharide export outer membrane protein
MAYGVMIRFKILNVIKMFFGMRRLTPLLICITSLSGGLPVLAQDPPKQVNLEQQRQVRYDSYVLGPGDSLQIELIDIPELSGSYSIGPDGTLYLPRLRAVYASGLTIEELNIFLTQSFAPFIKKPRLYIRPIGYRPIRVYVGGEVRRPGFYTLTGTNIVNNVDDSSIQSSGAGSITNSQLQIQSTTRIADASLNPVTVLPTVFDALRNAQGLTPYSNLQSVTVTRKLPDSAGGGKMRTALNFLNVIISGNEDQNIRLSDGDVITVAKSSDILRDQLLKAGQTNLTPQFLQVFVSGRVKAPGPQILPQASTLNQAIISAGGPKLLRGKVEFIRFTREGDVDRRRFAYSPDAPAEAYSNPVLMAGDIVRVNESIISGVTEISNDLLTPLLGIYTTYKVISGN